METHRTRGERRYQNWRRSRRARRIEHFINHGPRRRNCDCADMLWRFRDGMALRCRCLGKKKGAPKLGGSVHKSGEPYRPTVMRRIWNKRLARAWHTAAEAGGLDDCELPTGPIVGRRRRWAW